MEEGKIVWRKSSYFSQHDDDDGKFRPPVRKKNRRRGTYCRRVDTETLECETTFDLNFSLDIASYEL